MKISKVLCLLAALLLPSFAFAQDSEAPTAAEQASYEAEAAKFTASLHPQTGNIRLGEADATLRLGDAYYFLDKADSKRVIVDAWGNPPDAADGVLGMVFPKGASAFDSWGAVVTYEKTDYVSDDDANKTDYNKLIKDMQSGEDENNAERKKAGFSPMHLVGWAEPPSYNKTNHTMVWARDLKVGDSRVDTLNYDIRILGRRGVLSLNMIASMPELAQIRSDAVQLAAAGDYNAGARYTDYQKGDAKAAYGVGGLVAAGLGLAVAKKIGLLGIILAFGKKIIVFVLMGAAALGRWFSSIFGGKKKASASMAQRERAVFTDTPPALEASEEVRAEAPPPQEPTVK